MMAEKCHRQNTLSEKTKNLLVVGVAASAGGLEALTLFLRQLLPNQPLCLIIAQHLSPGHESMLAKLLSRESAMPVDTAENGILLEAGRAYVIPPGVNATVDRSRIYLTYAAQHGVPKPSANELFISLAEQFEERAVAVVLSGTGSDGARGCREIKARGGFTFSQLPSQAKYDGMPLAAIDTACIDRVLPAEEIAGELVRLAEFKDLSPDQLKKPVQKDSFSRILQLVLRDTGVDFSSYKDNTLHRRIGRRLIATDTSSWLEYEKFLQENPDETQKLYQDLLISVTAFFRDESPFAELEHTLRQIISNKSKGDEIRIWVAGCATGEEAYSIAMLLYDILDGHIYDYRIQLFATDIDLKALAIARKGRYDATALKGLTPERIKRHFNAVNDGFQINKHLREFVVFAKQNLVGDPAFLRLDLISCRNVLIYMKSELQKQVQATFHYGLNPNGYLFLGKSESLPGSELFEAQATDSRLFVRKDTNSHEIYRRYKLNTRALPLKPEAAPKQLAVYDNLDDKVVRAIARYFMQKAFVVDDVMDIRFVYGDLSEIIQLGKGRASLNLQHIIHADLQLEIKGLIFKAKKEGVSQRSRAVAHKDNYLHFDVMPLFEEHDKNPLYLIRYEISATAPLEISSIEQGEHSNRVLQLQHELSAMREHLQTVIEELETSNEELQAVNEELQSANEELQSTNEELETSNEELQSTNEELTTVNEEIQVKSNEIQALNSDLQNLQHSLPHPLVVLDKDLRLTHFNEAASKVLDLSAHSAGELLDNIPHKIELPDIRLLLAKTTQQGETITQQLKSSGRSYLLSVTSYRNTKGYGNGAVLLFWDNTELLGLYESLQKVLSENNLQARAIEAAEQGIIIVDATKNNMPILYANPAFSEMTGYSSEEIFGQNCRFLQGPDTDPADRAKIKAAIKNRQSYRCIIKNYRKDGKAFWNRLSVAPVFDGETLTHYIGIQSNITEIINSQREAMLAQTVFGNTTEKIAIFDPQQQLTFANNALKNALNTRGKIASLAYTDLFAHPDATTTDAGWSTISQTDHWRGELLFTAQGKQTAHFVSVNKMKDPLDQSERLVLLATDIAELKAREEQLHQLALYDDLTQLPNRLFLNHQLQDVVAHHHRKDSRFALLFLDLDNFKRINDSLGHSVGDDILQHLANTLRKLIRESDFCARISGDEFVVIMDELEQPQQAQQFANRLLDALSKPLQFAQEHLFISSSIGIAIYPQDGDSADVLLRNADIAMYRAKQAGKNQFQFVDPHKSDELRQQLKLESDLKRALLDDEDIGLHLHYQPYYTNSANYPLVGAEALIRCHHPQLGFLSPAQLLPAVKSANLEEAFDTWVFKTLINQRQQWLQQGLAIDNHRFSVNMHAEHLARLTDKQSPLYALLSKQPPLNWLTVELTEDALIAQNDNVKKALEQLSALKVTIAIDDFGSGYSNFIYLTELNYIGKVKLDKDLLRGIEVDPEKRRKVIALVHMLHELRFETVAEGVETDASLKALQHIPVNMLQGYFLSKPITSAKFQQLISNTGAGNSPEPAS